MSVVIFTISPWIHHPPCATPDHLDRAATHYKVEGTRVTAYLCAECAAAAEALLRAPAQQLDLGGAGL